MTFPDIMVDIETTGRDPERTAMIQLAGVRFNFNEQIIDTANMFNKSLMIPDNRYWEEDTRQWWGKQKREVLQGIFASMEPTREVMQKFADWVGPPQNKPVRFWAKPVTFDYQFVLSYLKQYEIHSPFHYRWVTDMNSFIRGLARDPDVESHYVEFQGDAHNALMDSINQINALFEAKKEYKK